MARPFTASDDQILLAARKVMSKRGPDAFSIAEVASEVGLSRAAIILRFKSTQALKIASLTEMVEQFTQALESLPKTRSGDNVLRLAAFIGSYVRSRESSAKFFARYSVNVQDKELVALEMRRGDALRQAVSNVMPPVAIDHESAITAFGAHLSGSIIAWLALTDSDSRGYLVTRTREWLKLTGIAFSEAVVEELTAPASTPQRAKTARSVKRTKPRLKAAKSGEE